MLDHERRWWAGGRLSIAGVDEAGRGPLAGPVVAAAVSASPETCEALFAGPWLSLTDSKKLTDRSRRSFFASISQTAGVCFSIGRCASEEIDSLNILNATHLAMRRAVEALPVAVDVLLIDGLPVKGLPVEHQAIVGGDAKSLLIAAASVVAKVTRDDEMLALDALYPGYGFARHKGYGTREHLDALGKLGPCPAHRRSFAPVKQMNFPDFGRE